MSAETLIILALLGAITIPFAVALQRANELFVVDVRDGEPTIRRGGVPKRLLADIARIVERPRVKHASLRCTVEGGRPMLRAKGALSDEQLQRLRNVVGTWKKEQIRSARRK